MSKINMTVEDLAEWFRSMGFTVLAQDGGYFIKGPESLPVEGIIAERGVRVEGNWVLALDHSDCYDKPQKCPIWSEEPESYAADYLERMLEAIHFLASNEGLERSNSYQYLDQPIWTIPGRGKR